MKSATVSLKLYSLALIFTFAAFLIFVSSKTFAAVEHDAVCEAIYINGTGVPNGGTYPTPIKVGEKFHAEIKMKNSGEKPWAKDQNYKLGIAYQGQDQDSKIWGLNRAELSTDNATVTSGNTALFKFDVTPQNASQFDLSTPNARAVFPWQMLREKTATDPGGRFGEKCSINIKLIAADGTTPTTLTGISDPKPLYQIPMVTQTTCVDNTQNVEKVASRWTPVAGAKSYTTTFYQQGGATGFSGCLDATKKSFAFSKDYSASEKYDINVIAYGDNNCGGGIVNRSTMQVPNGYQSALSDGYKYTSIKFNPVGLGNIDFPLNTCLPFTLTLPQPTGNVRDIPVTVTVRRSKPGNGTIAGTIAGAGEPHTVIFKYQPPFEDGGSESSE